MRRLILVLLAVLCLGLSGCGNQPAQPAMLPANPSSGTASSGANDVTSQPNAKRTGGVSASAHASPSEPTRDAESGDLSEIDVPPASASSASADPSAASQPASDTPIRLGRKPTITEQLADFAAQAESLAQKADDAQPSGGDKDDDWGEYFALYLELGKLEDKLARLDDEWGDLYRNGELSVDEHMEIQRQLNEMEQQLAHAQADLELRFNAFR